MNLMKEKRSSLGVKHRHKTESQSATDFLMTYAMAILIIVIVMALLFFFIFAPQKITPNHCTFQNNVNCVDMILMTNTTSHVTKFAVLISNIQEYPILDPQLEISLNGVNTTESCQPSFVLPGGSALCIVNMPTLSPYIGQVEAGNIYTIQKDCAALSTFNESQCSTTPTQTYYGNFFARAQQTIPISTSITLKAKYPVILLNQSDPLNATLYVLGYKINLGQAVVNLSTNTSNTLLNPNQPFVNSYGSAYSSLSSSTPQTIKVTAAYGNVSNSTIVKIFPQKFNLIENPDPSVAGTASPGSGLYTTFSIVKITATNSTNWWFKNWTGIGNGSYTGTADP